MQEEQFDSVIGAMPDPAPFRFESTGAVVYKYSSMPGAPSLTTLVQEDVFERMDGLVKLDLDKMLGAT
jgi:hypothetical protein